MKEKITPWKMMIEFPAEIYYKSISFYDYDILGLDYIKTAEEAIMKLSAWLEEYEKIQ